MKEGFNRVQGKVQKRIIGTVTTAKTWWACCASSGRQKYRRKHGGWSLVLPWQGRRVKCMAVAVLFQHACWEGCCMLAGRSVAASCHTLRTLACFPWLVVWQFVKSHADQREVQPNQVTCPILWLVQCLPPSPSLWAVVSCFVTCDLPSSTVCSLAPRSGQIRAFVWYRRRYRVCWGSIAVRLQYYLGSSGCELPCNGSSSSPLAWPHCKGRVGRTGQMSSLQSPIRMS